MAAKKQKTNLFTSGLLAQKTVNSSLYQEEENREEISNQEEGSQLLEGEEDDPLFGNVKRIRDITQKAVSVTDARGYPQIALEKLGDNPYQPRRRMNEKRLNLLAHEIQNYGFKGVLLARVHPGDSQRYQLVYGHRRREAAKLAGLRELPVMVDNTINDDEMKFLALNENVLRDDLTPLDEAYTFSFMLREMSQDAVAARLGVSRGYIRNRIDILKAPLDVQDMVEEKPDTMKAVVYLKDVQEDEIRKTVIQALMNGEITINQTKVFIENLRQAKITLEAPSVGEKMLVASSYQQDGQNSQQKQEEEINRSQSVRQGLGAKKTTGQVEAILLQQSKEQTEAQTDKTRIETFINYLHRYDQRLQNRQMTADEKVALDTLVSVARSIFEKHP